MSGNNRNNWNPEKYRGQQNIVDNLKLLYKQCINEFERPLTLEDEDIFDSYVSFCDAEAEDHIFPEVRNRYDAMVLDDMRYKMEESQQTKSEAASPSKFYSKCNKQVSQHIKSIELHGKEWKVVEEKEE